MILDAIDEQAYVKVRKLYIRKLKAHRDGRSVTVSLDTFLPKSVYQLNWSQGRALRS